MTETFKCPHCGALYEIITDEKTVSENKDTGDCRVCGKQMQMDVTKGSSILHYELVKMPDGTNV
jgi:transcription elongation factor Elf1